MKLYLCPGRKTSRNWSKPIKWCAFLFNMKIVYTARWRLFATPDTPCFEGAMIKLRFPSGFLNLSTTYFEIHRGPSEQGVSGVANRRHLAV